MGFVLLRLSALSALLLVALLVRALRFIIVFVIRFARLVGFMGLAWLARLMGRLVGFFAVIAVNNLARLLVYDILVVLVDTVDLFLHVMSDISHNNVVVGNVLLDIMLTDLNGVAVIDAGFDILAVFISLVEIIVAESTLDLALNLFAGNVALRSALVALMVRFLVMGSSALPVARAVGRGGGGVIVIIMAVVVSIDDITGSIASAGTETSSI
jgi:hypothetical protein